MDERGNRIYEEFKNEIEKTLFTKIYNRIINPDTVTVPKVKNNYDVKFTKFDYIMSQIELFKNKKTNLFLSEITIKNYKNKYKKIEQLHADVIKDLIEDNDVDDIITAIKEQYAKSYKDYITILIKIIDNVDDFKKEIKPEVYKQLQNAMTAGLIEREKITDIKIVEEPVVINWENYVKKVDEMLKDKDVPLRIKILFLLYKELPLRDDFYDVQLEVNDLAEGDKGFNYYNMTKRKLYLNNFKTESKFGRQVYQVSVKLNNLIKKYYALKHKYLIETDDGDKYMSLSKLVSTNAVKYFGIKFTINDIRKSVIAYYNANKSIEQRKKLAKKMLHSYDTQQSVYLRKQNLPDNYVVTEPNEPAINLS